MPAHNGGADRADAHSPTTGGLADEAQHLANQAREALPELRTRARAVAETLLRGTAEH